MCSSAAKRPGGSVQAVGKLSTPMLGATAARSKTRKFPSGGNRMPIWMIGTDSEKNRQTMTGLRWPRRLPCKGFHGVTVSTQDSESCDPSSNLGRTFVLSMTKTANILLVWPNWIRRLTSNQKIAGSIPAGGFCLLMVACANCCTRKAVQFRKVDFYLTKFKYFYNIIFL